MASRSRLHVNDQRLSNALGFASVENFHEWLNGRLVQPYFTFFETHTQRYKTEIEGEKGNEFRTIQRLITTGESGGKQRYSRDTTEEDMASWSFGDHQARLIYKLVSMNSDNFRGPFHGKICLKHIKSLLCGIFISGIYGSNRSQNTRPQISKDLPIIRHQSPLHIPSTINQQSSTPHRR